MPINDYIFALGLQVYGSNYVIGTGFRAHYSDAIWTNAHVIRGINDFINSPTTTNWRVFATKSGTRIGGSDTYFPTTYFEHPNYDGTALSPDVAVIVVESTELVPRLLPREHATNLRVGQPIATLGFPDEIADIFSIVPIATFKDGTISALRPFQIGINPTPFNTSFVQHNLDLSGGTSGSPIFDHSGWIIAVNNSGTEKLVFDVNTGRPERVPTGNIGFGVRVDEVWRLVDHLESLASTARINTNGEPPRARALLSDTEYPYENYQPFPTNWNNVTVEP
ncbi:MAG: serine protease [Gemmatimonadetes bacterium]|nr:serine protease [Gemmatimonadota bacterium]